MQVTDFHLKPERNEIYPELSQLTLFASVMSLFHPLRVRIIVSMCGGWLGLVLISKPN
jgi:hypothetical protein